jgi:microcompartment protein CcmK/EutM
VILCRVIGNSVSTVKHPSYIGHKVMVVQPVKTDTHTALGTSFLALDSVHAGVGDLVVAAREGNTTPHFIPSLWEWSMRCTAHELCTRRILENRDCGLQPAAAREWLGSEPRR